MRLKRAGPGKTSDASVHLLSSADAAAARWQPAPGSGNSASASAAPPTEPVAGPSAETIYSSAACGSIGTEEDSDGGALPTTIAANHRQPIIPTDVPRAVYMRYGLLQVHLALIVLGYLMTQPLLVFAQMKFFNGGHDCVTDTQTDTTGCKLAAGKIADVSAWTGFINSCLSLFLGPVIGRLSDSIGRRRVFVASVTPVVLQMFFLYLWAATDGWFSMWFFFAMQIFPVFSFTMASAYIADIIPAHHRATFFSVNSAFVSFTRIWAAAVAGLFDSFVVTTLLAFLLCLTSWFWALLVLPETLPDDERKPLDWADRQQLAEIGNFFRQIRILNRTSVFQRLTATLMISSVCSQGLQNIQTVYFRQQLKFTKDNSVRYAEVAGAGGFAVQLLVTPVLIRRFGEKTTLILGLVVFILYMALYGSEAVQTPTGAYMNSLIQDVSNVNYPAIVSIKSTLSAGNEQGQILGAISAVQSMAAGVGPFPFAKLFEASMQPHAPIRPSFVWWMGVVVMAGAVAMALTVPDPRAMQATRAKLEQSRKLGAQPGGSQPDAAAASINATSRDGGTLDATAGSLVPGEPDHTAPTVTELNRLRAMSEHARLNFGAEDPRYQRMIQRYSLATRRMQGATTFATEEII